MLTARDIRRKFLDYFIRNGHTEVASAPLVPGEDPSLLFTNAGMVQFKKLFLGEEKRGYVRATTAQKCLRVSGKHNDLENVGRTARHHTFFEMLGNFSFGDYFKRDAIRLAWDFVVRELGFPREKLWVTVFREDDEAFDLWREVAGLAPERIIRMGEKDNFWAMGDTGPCGPCSEIHFDQGEDMRCGPDCGIGTCDCDRFLEIWNLVFMQYDQPADGSPRRLLPRPSIDTGMGLERVAAICQGKRSNFDTDLFQQIIQYAAELAGVTYAFSPPDTNDTDTALRVIADHARAAVFLIADGVLPSNEGRGYVLRRLLRRALRFAGLTGVHEPFLYRVALKVAQVMGEAYPEAAGRADFIGRVVREEEERFAFTLDKGLALLEEELAVLRQKGETRVPGAVAFTLYDTYGFPFDIVSDVARRCGFDVDEESFNRHMREQRDRSRAARKGMQESAISGGPEAGPAGRFAALAESGLRVGFTGYADCRLEDRVAALLDAAALPVEALHAGERGFVVTGRTPFYGASGGQVGDTGTLETPSGEADVLDTLKPLPELIVHRVEVRAGAVRAGEKAELRVAGDERQAAARNHTGTHLLHAALRRVLGGHVRQAGSLVAPDRLRFDFTHIAAMSEEEVLAVEKEANRMVLADLPVRAEEMARDAAVAEGAVALFGEKYGEIVRVISVGEPGLAPESRELCGGTHVRRTGQIGSLSIVSEAGVAAGVRRIEAVTGWGALRLAREQREETARVAAVLKARPGELAARAQSLLRELKNARKDLDKAAARGASGQGGSLPGAVEERNGVRLLVACLDDMPIKALLRIMDDVRPKLPSGVACLAARENGRIGLVLYVSADLHDRFTAPALIREIVGPIAGAGGGRPDQAQAGGSNPDGYEQAMRLLRERVGATT